MPTVFIHGVSVRKERFDTLVSRVDIELAGRVQGMQVKGAYWGDRGASLRFGGKSIPGIGEDTRSLSAQARALTPGALADLLVEAPLAELRDIADSGGQPAGAAGALAAVPAAVKNRNKVLRAAAPGLVKSLGAAQAGLIAPDNQASTKALTALVNRTIEAAAVAHHAFAATDLVDPLTRALTAGLLTATIGEPELGTDFPWTRVQDAVAAAVASELGGRRNFITKGAASFATAKLRGGLRQRIMKAQSLFVGDVIVYMTHRDAIQRSVADQIDAICAEHGDDHLWLVGHSLGGIVAFEYCMAGHRDVERLVTVGSQVGLLAELGALRLADPPQNSKYPAPPRTQRWLNVYDLDDMLSFKAQPVFEGVSDHEVDTGAPFPLSHSEYWVSDKAYEAIVA